MPEKWLPETTMAGDIIQYERKRLLDSIRDDGVHLHLHAGPQSFWRVTFSFTKVCETPRCFRLKIKRLRVDT